MKCTLCGNRAVIGLNVCGRCYRASRFKNEYSPRVRNSLVYAWIHPTGVAYYVGRGSSHRASNHKNVSKWWIPELILLTMTCDNEWHSIEWEGKWGNRLKPLYNKDGNRK